jgi:hypothetical protein
MWRHVLRMSVAAFLLIQPLVQVSAQGGPALFDVTPELTQEQTRGFPVASGFQGEQTFPIDVPAKALIIQYQADTPFELWISFPTGGSQVNPLHILKAKLQPALQGRIRIDLTKSPAWYASRRAFILHLVGEEGSVVRLLELTAVQPTLGSALKAYIRQFLLDEPVLLSSINFLSGYHVADASVTLLLGCLFLMGVAIVLMSGRKKTQLIVMLSFAFILLYDARVSLDLLRVTAADFSEWSRGEYRQLGPIHAVTDTLKKEQSTHPAMKVVMCFDGNDLLFKELRYLLYPIPVIRPEEGWNEATHAVLMGMTSCGEEFQRAGEILQEFSGHTRIIRFRDATPS